MVNKISELIEGRMDIRTRTLINAVIEMDKAIILWGKVNDSKIILKHFQRVRNEAINSARASGITDRELKIIGVITKGADKLPRIRIKEASSIFAYTWDGVTIKDVKKIAKENKLKLKRDTNGLLYGFDKKRSLVFKYDQETLELITDFTLIDFMNKKLA